MIDEEAYRFQHAAQADEVARLNSVLLATGFTGDPIGFTLRPSWLAVVNQEDLTGDGAAEFAGQHLAASQLTRK